MRPCSNCTACCDGHLKIDVYGLTILNNKCPFQCSGCLIYNARPQVCKNYQCAWTQELFPEWMRPDQSGLMISVEKWTKGQHLRAIEITNNVNPQAIQELTEFAHKHNTPYIIMRHNKTIELYGPEDFIQEKR